jgi:propionyl-CoA carboxylase alpha chain
MMALASDDASRALEFTITLDGVEYPVEVDGGLTAPWKVSVNGRPFTVEAEEEGQVLVDGIAYDVRLEGDAVSVGTESFRMQVTGLSVGRTAPAAVMVAALPDVQAGAGAVVAIMPGKVTRVLVAEGQEVQKGEAVCVLEAMKMENELRAERDGTVTAVHVKAGDDVEKDQVLVEIEAGTAEH